MSKLLHPLTAAVCISLAFLLLFCPASRCQNRSLTAAAGMQRGSGVVVAFDPPSGVLTLSNAHVAVELDVEQGTLSYKADGASLLQGAYAEVSVDRAAYPSTAFSWAGWSTAEVTDPLGSGTRATLESEAEDGLKLTLAVTLYDDARYAVVDLALHNVGQGERTVESLTPLAVGPGGAFLRGVSPRSCVAFINSYTNVGYRGVVPVLPVPNWRLPAALADGTGNLELGNYSGWWVHALWNGKLAFVAGALTADKWKTSVQLKPDHLRNRFTAWQVDNLGRASLPPGETFRAERIFLGSYADPLQALEEYAQAVGEVNGVRRREKIAGWCSWPYYYRKITAADVRRNAQFIKDKLGSRYPYILIDSGWFTARGDWLPNDKFPQGMAEMARQIHGLGLKAGLWFAPFLVDKESSLLQEHPDWFVRREDGSLYVYKQDMSAPDRYVLDTSHPGVQEWLRQLFARVTQEWGYDYLKLDFLHAGAVEGKRYDKRMTGMEALRAGLRAIRSGAGEGAYIQQAIGPFLAPVGILDESRVSMDTEFRLTATTTTSDIPRLNWQYALWYIRNNLAGYFAQGNLFNIAPGEGMRLHPWTEEEAKTFVAFYVLSGDVWLAGDLTALPQEKVSLLTNDAVLALRELPAVARPVDLFARPDRWAGIGMMNVFQDSQRLTSRDLPCIIAFRALERGSSSPYYVGVFNWHDRRRQITLRFADIGLDAHATYSVTDVWSGEKLGEYQGEITLVVEPHAHRLLKVEGGR